MGVLAGGVLTGLLNAALDLPGQRPDRCRRVWPAAGRVLPTDEVHHAGQRLDVPGAGLVTLSLMIAVYAVVGGNEAGWASTETLGLALAAAAALMVAFVVREARVEHLLVPLRLFKLHNVTISQILGVLWAGAMFAWFFLSALYLQRVLGYGALQVGLAQWPACLVMAYCSLRVSDRLVMRIGIRVPLATGLGLVAVSLALFAFALVGGEYVVHVLPAMILLGLGAGIAFNPVLLAAMGDVEPHEAGLASGVVNTSFMMGGALGLAILVAVSSWWTEGSPTRPRPSRCTAASRSRLQSAQPAAAAAAIGGAGSRPKPMVVPDAEANDELAVPVHRANRAGSCLMTETRAASGRKSHWRSPDRARRSSSTARLSS